LITFHEASI